MLRSTGKVEKRRTRKEAGTWETVATKSSVPLLAPVAWTPACTADTIPCPILSATIPQAGFDSHIRNTAYSGRRQGAFSCPDYRRNKSEKNDPPKRADEMVYFYACGSTIATRIAKVVALKQSKKNNSSNSAQKSHVKPQYQLTLFSTTTCAWHFS